ncbi:hypothetical protein HNR26_004790 [Rhizobium rosettiformans]|uniref:Uncharacterized protein n=2 Tax=Rhizobium rosettiformans TaxID=1368430 RepID=A0A4V4HPG8_9HYPH|nr:hypothetical protein [Rhizobium rosettiformans]MBB5278688.1 hypothetical protein [Rhizobium rosettiformans]THV29956.1 hypothetical protein FAA86_23125 [Rhizobium rosettiformans W3]
MRHEFAEGPVDVGFHGWRSPKEIMDYPDLEDDVVVISTWNGTRWPEAGRVVRYLSDRKDALGKRNLWDMWASNALRFATREEAEAWIDEHAPERKADLRPCIRTIAELKALVQYPTTPWRRLATC